eukprot:71153-Ditylum_brightwellii.AAC.1
MHPSKAHPSKLLKTARAEVEHTATQFITVKNPVTHAHHEKKTNCPLKSLDNKSLTPELPKPIPKPTYLIP